MERPTRRNPAASGTAIGDGAAGNLGSGADRPGSIAVNFGTSGAVRCVQRRTSDRQPALAPGLFRYVLDDNRDVVGGAISNAGNLYQWCMRELRPRREDHPLSRRAAATDELTVLPFLVNERAPDWPENLHGTITGLTQTTTAGDLLRAATTSTFYRLSSILELLTVKPAVHAVIVSGGIAQAVASLRVLADCLGHDIRVSAQLESSLRGAAVYALEALGYECMRLPAGKLIRHDRALAAKHRQRRAAQQELQSLLESS
jgi:gluconokinase